jgi:hypothetical protein
MARAFTAEVFAIRVFTGWVFRYLDLDDNEFQ